jgi:ABC-type Fe3+/spermidine/putrescine transport system ATPase subunit
MGLVATEVGEIMCGLTTDLSPDCKVVVVTRPESIVLHRKRPAATDNVVEGKIATVMFLGEYLDCTVDIGKAILQTHQPHSLDLRRGEAVWVELPPGECMALPSNGAAGNS